MPPSSCRQPAVNLRLGKVWGLAVASRRRQLGITQGQLASLCGIAQQTISKIETGEVVPLDRLKLLIAVRLGTTPAELFRWPDLADLELPAVPDPEAA